MDASPRCCLQMRRENSLSYSFVDRLHSFFSASGLWLLLLFCLSQPLPTLGQEKSLFREQPPLATKEPELNISPEQAEQGLTAGSQRLTQLAAEFQKRVLQHLQLAGAYDLDAFRKNDDELGSLLDKMDAVFLDTRMLSEHSRVVQGNLELAKKEIQRSKLMMFKSSAIFYLCFGRPLQSCQYAKLGLGIAKANKEFSDYTADFLFYLGSGTCWAGDYKEAEKQLKQALAPGTDLPYTSVSPGTPVVVSGKNPFTPHYLATVYIAEKRNDRAIELLSKARTEAPGDEIRGNADALLSLAYALSNNAKMAQQQRHLAEAELDNGSAKSFPAIAKESLAIAASVTGDYATAEHRLSEALPALQDSPIKLGNKLEAAQTALWRSYCRDKLGNQKGAAEDRLYAMSFAEEAPHLYTLSDMLDGLFGKHTIGRRTIPIKDKWAVVVGIGSFADTAIPRLRYARKDAQDITDFLTRQAGFHADHVRSLFDQAATGASLLDTISGSWLPSASKEGDLVLLFISSHGTPAYKDIGALNSVVTYDTRLDQLFSTSIPMQRIVRLMQSQLPRRRLFVILDTCYAGGLGAPGEAARLNSNADPNLLLSSGSQLLVSSSSANERSWESKRYKNGVFTRQLIDSILQRMQYQEFKPVFQLVRDKVASEVATDFQGNTQTPELSGFWSGKGLTDELPLR